MYVNIIIYSNKLLLFVWSALKRENKKLLITVTWAQWPPPDLQPVEKISKEIMVKHS